jgi:small-conductance mechanosensitive channel
MKHLSILLVLIGFMTFSGQALAISDAADTGSDRMELKTAPVPPSLDFGRSDPSRTLPRIPDQTLTPPDFRSFSGIPQVNPRAVQTEQAVWYKRILLSFIALLLSYFLILHFIFVVNRNIPTVDDKSRFRRYMFFLVFSFTAFLLILILTEDFRYPLFLFGLGITFFVFFQGMILNIFTYFVLILRNAVKPGDRVTVSGRTGDVIGMSPQYIELAEAELAESGIWLKTGQIIRVPTREFLAGTVSSFSQGLNLRWDFAEYLLPADADVKKFKLLIRESIDTMMSREYQRPPVVHRAKELFINLQELGPLVYSETYPEHVRIVVKFISPPNQEIITRLKIEDITTRMLEDNPGIKIKQFRFIKY